MRLIPLLFGLAALAASSHVIAHEGMSNQANSPAPAGVGVAAGSGGQAVFIPPASTPATGLSLADALTVERRASLWFDYARDVAAVSTRLTSKGTTTLLVPIDKAIMNLPHKPHQNPEGPTDDDDASSNAEAFLAAHIVPGDLKAGEEKPTLLKGLSVRLEKKDGGLVVIPGDAKVVGEKEASNGRIYYLDGIVG